MEAKSEGMEKGEVVCGDASQTCILHLVSCIRHKKEIENMPLAKHETTLFLWSSFLSQRKVDTWFDSTRGLDADGVISRFGETERRGGAQ